MAGEYDINLSNGGILTTLYPMETSGPNNVSTPRLTNARPTFTITQIGSLTPNGVFKVSGDRTGFFPSGLSFDVVGSSTNDGTYVVQSSSYDSGQNETNITCTGSIPSATADGSIIIHAFVLNGDLTYRFVSGFTFTVDNPGDPAAPNNGTYTVDAFGSFYNINDDKTVIPVTASVVESSPPTLGHYQIAYKIGAPYSSDANTVLKLPGKGTINYGESIIENLVHITEHFASDTSPDTNAALGNDPFGQPLMGQLWYKTLAGEEGFQFFDGSTWSNQWDFDNGSIIFRDPQNSVAPNTDIYLTADESQLPPSYPKVPEAGAVLWTENNPNPLDAIFRVLSSGGAERIRIEHDGWVRTENNLEVIGGGNGSNESYFHGKLGIGDNGLPTIERTLTVEGNGIAVNADAGLNAGIKLDSPSGQASFIDFELNNTILGNITVNSASVGTPLEINSTANTNVVIATGGGNVGIQQSQPTTTLQIKSNIFFDEGNGDVTVGPDIRLTTDGLIVSDQSTYVNFDGSNSGSGSFEVKYGGTTSAATTIFFVDRNVLSFNTSTLYVDGATSQVGINTATPSAGLDVVGSSEFNGPVQIVGSDITFDPLHGIQSTANASIKTDGTGKTWTIKPGDATAAGLNVVDSTGSAIFVVDENVGTHIDQFDFFVNTNTLYVDVTNQRVGVNVTPQYPLDVIGDTQIQGHVGINQVPPTGGVWLGITGTVEVTSGQLLGPDQSQTTPTFSFTNSPSTGMYSSGANEISFANNGTQTASILSDGTIRSAVSNYETQVIDPNDIPNKKYVDDKVSGISWREPVRVEDITLYADSTGFPTGGTVDGVALNVGDRVLFSNVTNAVDEDIWIWNGTTWDRDEDLVSPGQTRTVGDTVYVQEGSSAHRVLSYSSKGKWEAVSSISGINVRYEQQVAAPGQLTFTLASISYQPGTNRLNVYVDGVKQVPTLAYNETDPTTVTFIAPSPFVGGEIVEFYAYDQLTSQAALTREVQTNLTGNPVITFNGLSYQVGSDNLLVYLNGQKMIVGTDYTETTNTSITWIGTPLVSTDVLEFYASIPVVSGTKLEDIENVDNAVPLDGDVLVYNGATGKWTAQQGDKPKFVEYVAVPGGTGPFATPGPGGSNVSGGTASLQVFLNGVLQREGPSAAYTYSAGQITFNSPIPNPSDVVIYEF